MLMQPLLFLITAFVPFGNGQTSSTELSPLNNWERYYMVNHGCRETPECATTEETCLYTKWTEWSNCTDDCAPLAQNIRTRTCRTDTCTTGICTFGSPIDTRPCSGIPCCKGFPKWSEWGKWYECGCRQTYHRRRRTCLRCKNKYCKGDSYEQKKCPPCPQRCVEKSAWTRWSAWSSCKYNHTECINTRDRTCSQEDCKDGSPCTGLLQQTNVVDCVSEGGYWGHWLSWSTCDAQHCNTFGSQTRRRYCRGRFVSGCRALGCKGPNKQTQYCHKRCCQAWPSWSSWSEWTECSRKCGHGIQRRNRKCFKGTFTSKKEKKACRKELFCTYTKREERTCFNWCCEKVKLGQWGEWSACEKPCGGVSKRKRICKAKKCPLEKEQCATMTTETRPCPKC